ncbi:MULTISPECIES: PfkB family carbohydrate kinase [Pseudomonas]|uniref:Sugar kinase n=1 Tax=Pseudomonas fulva TaxID=47880 RepID=A0A0D0KNR0_9PSED|nr:MULTISPECIES: PfkB family carbohydrate kinase [Pseudomonas]KIQ01271.1 sugar kinase [Pseudomonas fulva]
MAARLLYSGQVVVDLVMAVDALPSVGQDVLASSAAFEVGGGFNVMAAAARNGLSTCYLGRHGVGRFGDMARHAMAVEGIECRLPPSTGGDTGLCVALTDASAERSFISHVGAEGVLQAHDLRNETAAAEDWVMVSGYSLLHTGKAASLLSWLQQGGAAGTLVFDPGPLACNPALPGAEQLLDRLAIWSSNREEALQFTAADSLEQALQRLTARLPEGALVILRDGPQGCWLARDDWRQQVPGFAVQALDTNGAGDAHIGVFLASLAAGFSEQAAAARANAAAAIAVTRRGPATCPPAVELDAFLAAQSVV